MILDKRAMVVAVALTFILAARASLALDGTERTVTFYNGGVTLSGTLLLPPTAGAHAAVVFVHGSGPGPRADMRPLAERVVGLGFAALVYDKRGSGTSGGSWVNASLDDLADDALAAAAFLKTQPEIDGRRVGIAGVSQGGWVIPRSATRQPDAWAFAVIVTGGGLKPIDVERYDYAAALDALQVSTNERRDAMQLVDRYLTYLKTGTDRTGLEQAIDLARRQSWFKAVDVGRVMPTEEARPKWTWVPDYDPVSDIATLRMPVLVFLGGRDRPALSGEMSRRWRAALSSTPRATIIEFLDAGHGVTLPGTHHSGGAVMQSYVPGYLGLLDAWLRPHCGCE